MRLFIKEIRRWISRKYDDYQFRRIIKKIGGNPTTVKNVKCKELMDNIYIDKYFFGKNHIKRG